MGCRGGELSQDEIDILTNNTELCDHIQKCWKRYTYWADEAQHFCIDDEGDKLQVKDVLSIIEKAILGIAAKTGLNAACRKSRLSKEYFLSIVARAVYMSPKECPEVVEKLLKECRRTQP